MPDSQTQIGTIQVEAPNGFVWTRTPDGHSSPQELLQAVTDLGKGHIEREWDWW